MSQWVKASNSKPPTSMSVLLYVVTMSHDLIHLWSDDIILGFYSDELRDDYEGWFQEMLEHYEPFIETENKKVLAWTLLPEPPAINFKNKMIRTNLLDGFKNKGINE
jgi:hypothetical protein